MKAILLKDIEYIKYGVQVHFASGTIVEYNPEMSMGYNNGEVFWLLANEFKGLDN